MRDLLGYFIIAQAVITGIIVYSIQQLSTAFVVSQTGQDSLRTVIEV